MSATQTNKIEGYSDQERRIASHLLEQAYEPLLRLARNRRRRVAQSATLMTEDILHDCFLKLSGKTVWQSQDQFIRTASLAIRQVIVDHARKKLTVKHGSGNNNLALNEDEALLPEYSETPEQILSINDLLEKLECKKPRLSKVVDARYFAGLTESETAIALGVSERTIRRDWQLAKAWLAEKMDSSD